MWFPYKPVRTTVVPLPTQAWFIKNCLQDLFQKLPQRISKLVLLLEHVISCCGQHGHVLTGYPAPFNLATLILGHCGVEVRQGGENTPEEVQSSTLGQDLQDHEECVQFALKLEPWSLAQFFENL